jgi:hypothetical protein
VVSRIVALEGVSEIPVAAHDIVVAGSPSLLRFRSLDTEDTSAHLRRTANSTRRAASEDSLSLELETLLNRAPRHCPCVMSQEFRAAGEGGRPDVVVPVVQVRGQESSG